MQIVFDFVEGKIQFEEFWEEWLRNPQIGVWLDQLVDLHQVEPPSNSELGKYLKIFARAIIASANGLPSKMINKQIYPPVRHPNRLYESKTEVQGTIWCTVAAVVTAAYPDIKPTGYYQDTIDFKLDTTGDYYGGNDDVEEFIEEILAQFPSSMGKTKRIKAAKAKLKEVFHVQGQKYPRWVQSPEWPMGKNSPMEYISRRTDHDLVVFTFKDVDTGEVCEVEQYY